MNFKIVVVFLSIVLFLNCKESNEKITDNSNVIPMVNNQFQIFINQFPEIELPIKIIGCNVNFEELQLLNPEVSKPYQVKPYYVYGKIKTNGNYMATITLGAADCFLPILTTYTLTVEEIDSKTIATGSCDEGPCFICEEIMEVDENLQIAIINNITYSECDDNQESINGTEKKETVLIKGNLTTDGVIHFKNESNN